MLSRKTDEFLLFVPKKSLGRHFLTSLSDSKLHTSLLQQPMRELRAAPIINTGDI